MSHNRNHNHMIPYSSSVSSARSALTSHSLDNQRPPSLSFSTPSTAPTSQPTNPSDCENGECLMEDFDEPWNEQDDDHLDVADELPDIATLAKAAELPILSANGLSRPFKSLWQGQEHIGQRQLVVFIRHFYCGSCQTYVKKLVDTITPSYFSLPVPTTITIIGSGHPRYIAEYADKTSCPFPIYADPTRKIYRTLKFRKTFNLGKRPEFNKEMNGAQVVWYTFDELLGGRPSDIYKVGNFMQNGGELLFEDGQPVWWHRMRNMRDHAEMSTIRRVLDMDEEVPVIEDATAVTYSPMSPTTPTSALPITSISSSSPSTPTKTVVPGAGLKLVWEGKGTVKAHLGRENHLGL